MSSERTEIGPSLSESSDAIVPYDNAGLRKTDMTRILADARDLTLPSREAAGEIPMDQYETWFRTWIQQFPVLSHELEQLAFETLAHPPLPEKKIDELCDEYGDAWREHIPLSTLTENPEFFSIVDWEDENEAKIVNAIDHSCPDEDSDPTLFQFLTVCNIRLVAYTAHRYIHRSIEYIDLVDEGMMGLKKGVGRFDHRKGYKLSTYATWWIRQSITRAIANTGRVIRIPVHMGDVMNKVRKVQGTTAQQLGREPTDSELHDALIESGMNEKKVNSYFDTRARGVISPTSLNKIVGDREGNGSELGNLIPDSSAGEGFEDMDSIVNSEDVRSMILDAFGKMDERTARILTLRFGLDGGGHRTLQEVGDEIGVTRERIRQIERSGLRQLKRRFPHLEDLLDD